MKKIDKTILFSTEYYQWQRNLPIPHPKKSQYYIDVFMELMHCQDGLCAYTEKQLCFDADWYTEKNWKDSSYVTFKKKPCAGDLEHFDSTLKEQEYWKWENLFVADHECNNKKGSKQVDYILKPDCPNYDPFVLLEYNRETHFYHPNREKTTEEKKRIQYMIDTLELNHLNLVAERKGIIEKTLQYNTEEKQFPTAFKMIEK